VAGEEHSQYNPFTVTTIIITTVIISRSVLILLQAEWEIVSSGKMEND